MPLSHLVSAGQAQEIAPEVPPQALEGIRSAFEQEAGVGQFDPADPKYENRWQLAQPTEADRMRSLYGWGAYGEFQRQAALAAEASAASGR